MAGPEPPQTHTALRGAAENSESALAGFELGPCDPAFILPMDLVPLYAVELPAPHKFPES